MLVSAAPRWPRAAAVARLAAAVRVCVWLLGVVSALVATPYDSSVSSTLVGPPLSATTAAAVVAGSDAARDPSAERGEGYADALARIAFGPFAHWDGVFMLRLAEAGYEYEQFHAFFPLMPLLMRGLASTVLLPLYVAGFSHHSVLLIAGCLLSSGACVAAAAVLYVLGCSVLRSEEHAYYGALLFAVGPASVFMSAVYTESIFALCAFTGMALLSGAPLCSARQSTRGGGPVVAADDQRGDGDVSTTGRRAVSRVRATMAAACFGTAGLARSNGTLLVGYTLYYAMVQWAGHVGVIARERTGPGRRSGDAAASEPPAAGSSSNPVSGLLRWLGYWLAVGVNCGLVLGPFVAVQYFGYFLYCAPAPDGLRAALPGVFPEQPLFPDRPWCGGTVPGMYAFIQAEYWNNGFMHYYEPKQIPNFVLAAPILGMSAHAIARYARSPRIGSHVRGTLRVMLSVLQCAPRGVSSGSDGGVVAWQPPVRGTTDVWQPYHSFELLPYMLHYAALCVFNVLFMHIQVSTRFLSASPPFYWWLASWLMEQRDAGGTRAGAASAVDADRKPRLSLGQYLVGLYFGGYAVVGTMLFCNFYPWT